MLSYDASTATDLAPVALVLADLVDRARACGIDLMVVGAAARDILITHVLGTPPDRATSDVDIAVSVGSWPALRRLTEPLQTTRNVHTFVVRGCEVDVIPFGGIESPQRTITWPNEHTMDVLGFQEALACAVLVTLPGGVEVPVASLPAQSVLKLLAWKDRRYSHRKDAVDLRTILAAYAEGIYLDQLYDGPVERLERHGFGPATAAAERLGSQARALIGPAGRTQIGRLLDGEMAERLAGDMGGLVAYNREVLAAYREGFLYEAGR
jgi:predicted nucleotidyltransferase